MAEDAVTQLATWRQRSLKGKINSDIVVVGLQGSGKSALVNALFNEEVSQEQEAISKPEIRKGDKHVLNYRGSTLTVWDTCGFFEASNPENEGAFTAIESIPCMKKRKCCALVVAIAISKTRFEKNANDIQGMKRLKEIFGGEIWNNLLIVLTRANEHYSLITSERSATDMESYKASYSGWVEQIRSLLASELMPRSQALTVPIVPAGYLNSIEAEGQVLPFEPKGKSWILNIWQNLAKVVPVEEKPLLLDVCINKLFSSKFFFFDCFLSLIALKSAIYKEKVCLIKNNNEYKEASLALSMLHSMLVKLDNHDSMKRIVSSESYPQESKYWKNLDSYINVAVTGLENSGKTALINSLAYQKEKLMEQPYGVNEPELLSYGSTTCSYTEAELGALEKSTVDCSAIVIVCIKICESNVNLTKILSSFARLDTKHFIIALTYSNGYALEIPLETLVEIQTANIKKILLNQPNFDSEFEDKIAVVPVGYHSELIIKNDSTKMHWIMNLFLHIISNAKTTAQAALLVMVNYHIFKPKTLPKKLSHCKGVYIQHLVKTITNIIKTNNL